MSFNLGDTSSLTWLDIQQGQAFASIFGILCFWGAQTVYSSFMGFYKKRKLIFLLNFLQTLLLLIKTISATVYATYFGLNCAPRGPLVNIPLVLAWDLIFVIILLKILLFTTWPRTAIACFSIALLTHLSVVMIGLFMRKTSMTVNGTCRDVYPLIYKQQYAIEVNAAIQISCKGTFRSIKFNFLGTRPCSQRETRKYF